MPFCVACGKELSYSDKFCSACGKENAEYRPDSGPKTGEYDITITPKIRLYGPHDAKTEIELYIPQLRKTMYLRFPNFFELGQTLRVHGEGLTKPNGEKGDLLVTPTEVEYYDTELTISARLVGAADAVTKIPLYLPHAGKTVQISVPNNMTAGKTLRLKGLGLDAPRGEKGDLYLCFDHIEYEKEQPTVQKKEKSERKTVYEGELHKCPSCGEIINSFVSVCPSCGHEMRGSKATSSVHELAVNLNKAQSVDDKERLIRNFYIPNTREDIIEFLILASSNIETNSDCVDAWAAKLEQVYQKAKLTFGDGAEFEYVETMYNKTTAKLHMKKNITNVTNASVSLLHGTGTVISTIWKCLCSMLAFVWRIVCTICKRFGTGYSCALLLFGIGSLVALVPDLWEIADGLRAISLIVAAVTLFGRAWRALDK